MVKRPDRSAREARQLLRDSEARRAVHARQLSRRKRDNWIGAIAAIVVCGLAGFAQFSYFTWGPGMPEPAPTSTPTPGATDAPTEPPTGENVGAPSPDLAEGRTWTGTLTLNDIPLGIELDGAAAPQAVAGWVQDAADGYYEGKTCHRMGDAEGFELLQCGSLDGVGGGDPDFSYGPVENAPADGVYPAGTIAMARQGDNAYGNGHQFFLVTGDTMITGDSAGGYTVVGRVTTGLEQLIAEVMDAGIDEATMGIDGTGQPAVPTVITAFTIE